MTQFCQQDDVYAAERDDIDPVYWFGSAKAAERWIEEVRELEWFRRQFPNVRGFELYPRSGGRRDSVGTLRRSDNVVVAELGPLHLNGLYVCHEVSHGLSRARYEGKGHHPWFCRIYLELVWHTLGPWTYKALWDSFRKHGVDCDPGPESSPAAADWYVVESQAT